MKTIKMLNLSNSNILCLTSHRHDNDLKQELYEHKINIGTYIE